MRSYAVTASGSPAAIAVGEQATLAAGDSALMFTVRGGNKVAMNLYVHAGYQPWIFSDIGSSDGPVARG